MKSPRSDYPHLASLISGWLHQDFDVSGETLEDVINTFCKTSNPEEQQLIRAEISEFLAAGDDVVDEQFQLIFNPDIDPRAFAPSTRGFLQRISRILDCPASR